ncbi:hypothetical protein [Peptoniphilus indolicus]|uniref:hypothetical protein n=1 Tax=Peptoniphilus indolicus TaxID=33030 RepID=UPI001559CCFC|nr:hypothetical protein [Peptoniphilus indolicus]
MICLIFLNLLGIGSLEVRFILLIGIIVSWALENVRKRIQRDVSSKLRVFLREARV